MKFDKTAQQRFTDLYKRYYKLMYHVAFEVLHNRVTTEDVVHTSCVRVLEHFSQVSAIDSPQTRNFVAIITKRIALTECSRMTREVPADVPTELENFDDLHETPVVLLPFRKTPEVSEVRTLQTASNPPPAHPAVPYFLFACYFPVPPCTCFPLTCPVFFPPGCPRRLLIPSAHNCISPVPLLRLVLPRHRLLTAALPQNF